MAERILAAGYGLTVFDIDARAVDSVVKLGAQAAVTAAGAVGVFGGSELSTYLYQLHQNRDSLQYLDGMQLMVTNDKDHLCTQASYRLDLRGPSIAVQTTCSTSLVAVSLACESLHVGRSDMALAGGVTVRVPQRGGYFYTAGSILSPDGHCRPFDANAHACTVGVDLDFTFADDRLLIL